MSTRGRNLKGGSDDVLAAAIAIGQPWRKAAAAAGVSVATVGRRMAQPEFRARVAEFRREAVTKTVGELLAAMPTAAKALGRFVRENGKDRVAAARGLLEFGLRYLESVEMEDVLAKVGALEKELEGLRRGEGTQEPTA